MDKELKEKIKTLVKEASKNTQFKGSITDDRMAPLKESFFVAGAEAMYELLKERLGNWIDEKCVPVTMELGEGIVGTMPLPESWLNKDDGKLPKMAIMMPGEAMSFTETAERSARIFGPDGPAEYAGGNGKPGSVSYVIPALQDAFPTKFSPSKIASGFNIEPGLHPIPEETWIAPIYDDKGEEIKAPNPERSVAEKPKSKKKTPASKEKNK